MGYRSHESHITFGERQTVPIRSRFLQGVLGKRDIAPVKIDGKDSGFTLFLDSKMDDFGDSAEVWKSYHTREMRPSERKKLAKELGFKVVGGPKKSSGGNDSGAA